MATTEVDLRVQEYWSEAEGAAQGLADSHLARLAIAGGAIDSAWDRHVFDHAETFGGAEIRFARAVTSRVISRLLGVEYAALVSAAGGEMPSSGVPELDAGLDQARHETLDTFSGELLGPTSLAGRLVYGKPVLLDGPVPIGAVLIASSETLAPHQERLLGGILRGIDTRLAAAEQLLALRRRNLELALEVRRHTEAPKPPEPSRGRRTLPPTAPAGAVQAELAARIPALSLFGVELPSGLLEALLSNLRQLTDRYLSILEAAPNLYLDVPDGIDAKDGSPRAAPYARLLQLFDTLRGVARALAQVTANDLSCSAVDGRAPTFTDLTRAAAGYAEDPVLRTVLGIMNDQGEEAELDALLARSHPYEFRVATTGSAFAVLALDETVKNRVHDRYPEARAACLRALPSYRAARAYLLSYDRFEDVPLKGMDRTQPPDAEKLLLYREKAPSFGLLLVAHAVHR